MKGSIVLCITTFILLVTSKTLTAGDPVSLQLREYSTRSPIEGASYRFSAQVGVSDSRGQISFQYNENDTLFLSHIGFGEWHLCHQTLKNAIKVGITYREAQVIDLQPVTVIDIRPKHGQTEYHSLDVHDRLSHDAGAILNRSAAVGSIRKSGSYGFDPVLRGFKYEQLNIVIDGAQCATAACPNRMDPPTSQVAPNMMDRVEVFKGPHSFRYGTSFGGTINFESGPMRFSQNQDFYGRLSTSSESNGGILRTEGAFGVNHTTYDLGILGSYSGGGNYNDGNNLEIPAGFQRASFGINFGVKPAQNQELRLSATRNIANDTDFPALPMDLRSDKTWLLNAKHRIDIVAGSLKTWNTSVFASLVDHLMDNELKDLSPRMVNARTDAETRAYGGRTEGTWSFGTGKLYTGFDLRIEKADGIRTLEFTMGSMQGNTMYDNVWNGGRINRTGVFGEYHFNLSAIRMMMSGRLEVNHARATNPDPGFLAQYPDTDKTEFNPNLSLGGTKYWSSGLNAGLWLGRAKRSGSITERYINSFPVGLDAYDMYGNPQLEAEINHQMDLIIGYKANATYLNINVFGSFLSNYISSLVDTSMTPAMPSSPGVRRYMNIDDAFMAGFEITWAQRLFAGLQHNLNLAYTYGQDKVRDEPLPEIAPLDLRYSLSANYLGDRFQPVIVLRHVRKQERVSSAFGETATPAFTLLDAGVTSSFSPRFGATLGVNNLFDVAYYEHLNRRIKGQPTAIYAPGRNVYLTLFMDLM